MILINFLERECVALPGRHAFIRRGPVWLFVTASGAKLRRMSYRFMDKQKLLSFGAYPAVSLADARRAHATLQRRFWQPVTIQA